MWICIAPRGEHNSQALRYGTGSQAISQFYLHICIHPLIKWTVPDFAFPVEAGTHLPILIYWSRRDGRLSRPWVAGWLHTEINVHHREMNPDTVTDLSTNRAQRRLTLLSSIKANVLTTMPDRHKPYCGYVSVSKFCMQITIIPQGGRQCKWLETSHLHCLPPCGIIVIWEKNEP